MTAPPRPRALARSVLAPLAALAALACSDGTTPDAHPASAPRRWSRPPSSAIRAYPPHAIRPGVVGPYRLGMPLSEALHLLPEGPRVELLSLGDLLSWRVVRAEGDAMIFGAGEDNQVAFVSVVNGPVARTETGALGVGATGAELLAALGPELPATAAWDRRVFELVALPGVLFVSDAPPDAPPARAKIVTIVVTAPPVVDAAAPPAPAAPNPCRAGGRLAEASDELAEFVGARPAGPTGRPLVRFGCVTGAAPEAISVGPGVLDLIGGEPGHLRRLAHVALPTAHVVSPIDVDGDGKDEIVVAAVERAPTARTVSVTVLDWDGARLSMLSASRPVVITSAAAASAGTTLAALDLALAFRPVGSELELGGLFLTRAGNAVQIAAPLTPLRLKLGRRTAERAPAAPELPAAAPAARPARPEDATP